METLSKSLYISKYWRLLAGGFSVVFWLILYVFVADPIKELEAIASDAWWRWQPTVQQDERRVVIVDIDEESLAYVGAWPWSSAQLQRLSTDLYDLGASQQIFDMVFPAAKSEIEALASVLNRHSAIVGQAFGLLPEQKLPRGIPQDPVVGLACKDVFPRATGVVSNHSALSKLAAGHITPYLANDGAVRQIPALICSGNMLYPALAVRAWLQGINVPLHENHLSIKSGQNWAQASWLLSLSGGVDVPLDDRGALRVPYRLKPESLISISARDVMRHNVPEGLFKGAWVLVGSTALGLADAVPTPHSGGNAGVSVQAQVLTALLDQRIPFTPQWAVWGEVLFSSLGILLLYRLAATNRWLSGVVPSVVITYVLIAYSLHGIFLIGADRWIPWLFPTLAVVLYGICIILLGQLVTHVRQEQLYQHLLSYAPRWFTRRLLQQANLNAVMEHETATVLVADLRNFSNYSDVQPAPKTAQLLHQYLTTLSALVQQAGGEIETMYGDTVVALWRTNNPEDGALAACYAAQSIVRAMQSIFQEKLSVERDYCSQPDIDVTLTDLAISIGIEYGDAVVGVVGDWRRRHHIVLGEAVRVALQLQSLSSELASPILLGDQVYRLLPSGACCTGLGMFLLEGFIQPRSVYALAIRE